MSRSASPSLAKRLRIRLTFLFNKRSVPNKPNSRTPSEIDRDTAARYTRRFYRDVLTSSSGQTSRSWWGGRLRSRTSRAFSARRRTSTCSFAASTSTGARDAGRGGVSYGAHVPALARQSTIDEFLVDLIFGSGNGVAPVDDVLVRERGPGRGGRNSGLDLPRRRAVWSKAFVMERERYDGAE